MKILRRIFIILFGVAFFASGVIYGVEAAERQGEFDGIVLVAHRAGAYFAPENTIAALEQAIQDGASVAEIDVQELSDGTLIVMHDSNFLRTAGIDRNVWEVDYDEFLTFEVGSSFSDAYIGEMIPTLDDFLQCAGDRIGLMIELKSTGHEELLEAKVLDSLYRHGMADSCIVGSQNEMILKRIKQIDENICTVFIAYDLDGEQYDMPWADSFSINFQHLNGEMVDRLHGDGKTVYGWTANTHGAIQSVLKSGADGIITDNVYEVRQFLKDESILIHLKNYLPKRRKMI